ncbi:MAG: Fic family protein [Patescibacteria group bacterium]|nr:Fic family protein [Patescibacteria group bacterium]
MFEPKYRISEILSELLTEIAVVREKIVSAKVLPKREIFLTRRARARMIHSSTAIEGNPLDLRDVEAVLVGKIVTGTTKKDILEIVNYQEVLEFIDKAEGKKKLEWEKGILEIHRLTTKNILSGKECGKYRKGPVYIIQKPSNKVIYTAPEARVVVKMIKDFSGWLGKVESSNISPVIMAAIGHHQLVTIHPFVDGNGRTARALATLILYRKDYDVKKMFALEDYYNLDRQKYYQEIEKARKEKDLTSWLEYFAQGFLFELEQVWEQVEDFTVEVKAGREAVYLSKRQRRILDFIVVNGRIYRSDVVDITNVSEKTAYRELEVLRKDGFIKRKGKGPATYYQLVK